MRLRVALGAAGLLLGLFGVFRLLTQVSGSDLVQLAVWLVAALVIHDGVVAPATAAFGWGLERIVAPRARRAVAFGLTAGVGVTVIALAEIYRQGSQAPEKALLRQDYTRNLLIALGCVAAVTLLGYVLTVVRDYRAPRPSATNVRPSDDQVSSTE